MHPGPGDFTIWRKIEIEPWAKWFAWRPVKVQGKRIWLKTIYRRQIWHFGGDPDGKWASWQYSTLFDILKHSQ